MIGLYAFIVEKRRRAGLLTLLLGWGWALTAVLLIQPIFAGDNIHWGRYDYLGVTTLDKLAALFTRPDLLSHPVAGGRRQPATSSNCSFRGLFVAAGAGIAAARPTLAGHQPAGRLGPTKSQASSTPHRLCRL